MSIFIIILFSSVVHVPLDSNAKIAQEEVAQLSGFVSDLDYTIAVAVKSSTFKVLEALVKYHAGHNFIADPRSAFMSCFLNNTFQPTGAGTWIACSPTDVSFTAQLNDLFALAQNTFDVTLSDQLISLDFNQSTAYSVQTDLLMNLDVKHGLTEWNKIVNLSEEVSIVGINDPLLLELNISQPIQFRPYNRGQLVRSNFFHDNFTMIEEYMNNSWYYRDNSSPSFFGMLQGSFPASESEYRAFGITSFMNVSALGRLWNNHTSYVEHHFFGKYHTGVPTYNEAELRRIGFGTINDNFLVSLSYLNNQLDGKFDTSSLKLVEGCCFDDPVRCISTCG